MAKLEKRKKTKPNVFFSILSHMRGLSSTTTNSPTTYYFLSLISFFFFILKFFFYFDHQ